MSAIACKILLCSTHAAMVSKSPAMLVKDLENNSCLAKDIIKVQENYIHTIEPLIAKLAENG